MEEKTKSLDLIKIVSGTIQAKTYSFAAFTIVVVIILLAGAIRPTLVKISEIQKEVNTKTITNKQLDNKIEALSKLSNEYAENRDSFATLPLVFPAQGNFSLLLSNIEEVAKENGFVLTSINFGKTDNVKLDYQSLRPWIMKFSVSGSRANLIPFLARLEELPMYPTITKVNYSIDKESNQANSFSIEMTIYKLDDERFYL